MPIKGEVKSTKKEGGFWNKKIINIIPVGEKQPIKGVCLFGWEFKKDYPVKDENGNQFYVPATKNFDKLYKKDSDPKYSDKYVVPVECLIPVPKEVKMNLNELNMTNLEEDEMEIPDTLQDLPLSNMTLRQYACIHLGVPQTEIGWLDDLIIKSPR